MGQGSFGAVIVRHLTQPWWKIAENAEDPMLAKDFRLAWPRLSMAKIRWRSILRIRLASRGRVRYWIRREFVGAERPEE